MNTEAVVSFNSITIPTEILLNRKLSLGAQVLFGLLRNLSRSSKGCWASNRWLGQIMDLSADRISALVSLLQSEKCIKVIFIKREDGTNQTVRHIFIDESYFAKHYEITTKFNDEFLPSETEEVSIDPLVTFKDTPPYFRLGEGVKTPNKIKDKLIEDKINKNPPIYPPCGEEPKKEKADKYFIKQLPTTYQQDKEFITVWKEYIDDRKKTTLHAVTRIINDMRKSCRSDIAFATRCIETCVKNGWTGIRFDKEKYQKQERQWPKSEDGMYHTDKKEYDDMPVEVIYNNWEPKDEPEIKRPKRRGSALRM